MYCGLRLAGYQVPDGGFASVGGELDPGGEAPWRSLQHGVPYKEDRRLAGCKGVLLELHAAFRHNSADARLQEAPDDGDHYNCYCAPGDNT